MTSHHLYVEDSPAGVAHDQTVRLCGSDEQTEKQLEHLQIARAAFGRPWRQWLPAVIGLLLGLIAVVAAVDSFR